MMDRILNVEFQPLSLIENPVPDTPEWIRTNPATEWRPLTGTSNLYWVTESKIDLGGYTLDDLTVYFRNSFEQRGGSTSVGWDVDDPIRPLEAFRAIFQESTILTTVPMTDANLSANGISAPGFNPLALAATPVFDYGNFNREHIIHGTSQIWAIDLTLGSDSFDAPGDGICKVVQSWDFSSLEPTAADCIYCYRILYLPEPYDRVVNERGLDNVNVPPSRVILNAKVDKEADLEYMMRLKRSYELANQV